MYEPSEILVEHIGDTDPETTVCGGEDGLSCGDAAMPSSATTDSYPSTVMQQPTEMPAGLPSAERRRRRRRSNNFLSNDYNFENDFRSLTSRQGWKGDNWLKYDTAILGILLILAIRLLSIRGKIMQDIRRTRQDALINNKRQIIFLPRYIRQIPLIVSIVVKNLMSEDILQQSKQLITNPSQTPQILYELLISIWYLLGDFLQQLQYFLRSLPILRTLFGTDMMVIGDEFVPDNIPELEDKSNNDVGADHDKKANSVNGHGVTQATKPRRNSKSSKREVRYDINDLPPAFENEEDYPPGWLMYHPKYGVRTREYLLAQEQEA